jgi:hypothetical protein
MTVCAQEIVTGADCPKIPTGLEAAALATQATEKPG